MRCFIIILFVLMGCTTAVQAQLFIDKKKFFEDSSVVRATVSLNFKKLMAKSRQQGLVFPAVFTCRLANDLGVTDNISVEVRGHFRREECYLPPMRLIFKNNPNAAFFNLKALKLVSSCRVTKPDEQNLLKEYLIYKMYNLICDKSFRVRLLNLTYEDSSGSKKPVTQYAFLIEDIKEVARRNECFVRSNEKLNTELTDRAQMTKVALFEYMIGNTDWSVPANHNTRLITSSSDSSSRPFVVPYDFDFSGLVNTTYSTPDERLEISSVRQRLYRGFARTEEELTTELAVFIKQKEKIYAIINNCNLLSSASKKDMINYLDDFYAMTDRPREIRNTFIANARKE